AMVNLIIENVGPEQTGVATGMNAVTRTVGGAFGGAVVASILAGSVEATFPSAHGFTVAFAACAIAVAFGVLVGLAIPGRGAGAVADLSGVPDAAQRRGVRPGRYGAALAPDRRPLLGRVLRPPLRPAAGGAAAGDHQGRRVRAGARGCRRLQAAELDDAADRHR